MIEGYLSRTRRNGEEAGGLAKDNLLASLSCDGLVEKLSDFARIKVGLKTPDSGLTKAGYVLGEVEGFMRGLEGVVVCALRSGTSWTAKQVGEKSGVANFLIGHELNQETVAGCEASCGEVLLRESGQNVVEEIEFDPFLVETEENGHVVKIGLDAVDWLCTIGTETTRWLVRDWFGVI